ncbi:MAG: T9SS type A sorting domain-containing protein [Bacteroidia bacterium]
MRKSLLLLLLAFAFSIGFANAQICTPDLSFTEPGMYPGTDVNLPYGYAGVPYSTSVQFKVLTDTTISGTHVTVTNITLDSVSGMPPGFSFSSTPVNHIFPAGSNACASLYGTPTVAAVGTYHLVVHVMVRGLAFGFIPVSQAQTVTGYKIIISGPPIVYFSGTPTTVCPGEAVIFDNNTTGKPTVWSWSFPGGTPSSSNLQVPPPVVYTTAGTKSVTLTASSPAGTDTKTKATYITVNGTSVPATVTPAGNVSICQGANVTLSANTGTGLTYQWIENGVDITGATSSTYIAAIAGDFSVRVTNSGGCSNVSAKTTVALSPVTASITPGGPITFCNGENVVLNANTGSGLTYQWRIDGVNISGATNNSYTATVAGAYKLNVTNASGCSALSGGVIVTVYNVPSAAITPSGPVTFCRGNDVALAANTGTGLSYQWSNAFVPVTGATGSTHVAGNNGWFRVTVTNSNGCTRVSNMIHVYVDSLPSLSMSASGPLTFCDGQSVMLTANTGIGVMYQWKKHNVDMPGATTNSITVIAAGKYSVVVTNAKGCTSSSSKQQVIVNTLPSATVSANGPLTICEKQNLILTANTGTGFSYQWKKHFADISGETGSSFSPLSSGSFRVLVTNTNGCTRISPAKTVIVNSLPPALITANGPLTFCSGQNVQLIANSGAGLTYQWTKHGNAISGATAKSYIATHTGVYRAVVTNSNDCSKSSNHKDVVVNCRQDGDALAAEGTSAILYPNPASSITTIEMNLAHPGLVSINIFDMAGKLVAVVAEGNFVQGNHQFDFDASQLQAGIYLVKISSGETVKTIKLAVKKN